MPDHIDEAKSDGHDHLHGHDHHDDARIHGSGDYMDAYGLGHGTHGL